MAAPPPPLPKWHCGCANLEVPVHRIEQVLVRAVLHVAQNAQAAFAHVLREQAALRAQEVPAHASGTDV